ncbi:MAG: hypothetical protein RR365_08005 [Bacteroides sp.]
MEQNGKMIKYRNRENEVLFVDLRQWGEAFEKKYIQFSEKHISSFAMNFHNWQHEGWEAELWEYCGVLPFGIIGGDSLEELFTCAGQVHYVPYSINTTFLVYGKKKVIKN